MKSLTEYLNEAENYSVGDAFSFEFADLLSVDTVIVDIVEDGVVVNIDDKGINLLIENNLTLEEKARDDYHKDIDGDHVGEGYKILPPMDKEKYQERDGLEGPFSTLSGKVVYYDPKQGSYYDPDTDMYISYDEFRKYDNDYSDMKDERDEVDRIAEIAGIKREKDNKGFTDKQIKQAYGIANDPRYAHGNMTGAVDTIEKIAKGLSDHPGVRAALTATQVDEADIDEGRMSDIDIQAQEFAQDAIEMAKDIQKDDYYFSDSTYFEFTDGLDMDDEVLVDHPLVQTVLRSLPNVDMDDREIKQAVDALANMNIEDINLDEAEYQGRKVQLNKPTRGDVKKFKVYVKDPKTGNVKKVNFGHGGTSAKKAGQKTMKIKKSNPARRKSFRARHNCDNPGPKTKARYWSCRAW